MRLVGSDDHAVAQLRRRYAERQNASAGGFMARRRTHRSGQEAPVATVGFGLGHFGDGCGLHLAQPQQSPQEASFDLPGCYRRTDKAVHGHDSFFGLEASKGLNAPPKIELLARQNGDAVAVQHHPSRELSFIGGEAAVVGAGANVLSFGRFQNADGFAAALA